jgi:hypothetical protein
MTFEQALELVDEYGEDITKVMELVSEVIAMAFGAQEGKKPENLALVPEPKE